MDRPMRLSEIYVAAEHALQNTISDPVLWKSFSSVKEFEVSNVVDSFEFFLTEETKRCLVMQFLALMDSFKCFTRYYLGILQFFPN